MRLRLMGSLVGFLCLVQGSRSLHAEDPRAFPSLAEIQAVVDQHFAENPQLRTGDIISQNEVRPLFSKFEASGWKVEDRDEILKKLLSDNDPLLRILRGPDGSKFMGQVANDKLIYDRLDRIAREPGGQRLLSDLVKLPNAARFAKYKTQPGVPDLEDFLPKDRSGKTRRVKDYDKATEKIYTVADFKKALQKSYETARRKDLLRDIAG
ncbi:MAG: hypothetical protein O3C40_05965 [Planctomycetota bacterium]|nr:hypothetical protein [Planctomycetota bacterium]